MQALYPACCYPGEEIPTRAEQLYCANLRGGDPSTAGKNYQGLPCPMWADLPANIRAKWEATARL